MIALLAFMVLSCPFALGQGAPPNAVNFSSVMYGTWKGSCTTEFYVNPAYPSKMQCALPTSLNQFYTYPFSVTFGPGDSYSFTSGKFAAIGQNESFSNARVNMTNYEYSKSGTMSSKSDIQNGGSYCITLTWQDGSTTSNFLGTLVQSIGGYYVWLEEGIRSFATQQPTSKTQECPDDSNSPAFCDPDKGTYSYTCYAIIKPS